MVTFGATTFCRTKILDSFAPRKTCSTLPDKFVSTILTKKSICYATLVFFDQNLQFFAQYKWRLQEVLEKTPAKKHVFTGVFL